MRISFTPRHAAWDTVPIRYQMSLGWLRDLWNNFEVIFTGHVPTNTATHGHQSPKIACNRHIWQTNAVVSGTRSCDLRRKSQLAFIRKVSKSSPVRFMHTIYTRRAFLNKTSLWLQRVAMCYADVSNRVAKIRKKKRNS